MIRNIKLCLIAIFFAFIFITSVHAAEEIFFGKIVGLSCVTGSIDCNSDMYINAHLELEKDFVFLLENGEHFMLPNVPKNVKLRYAGKPARIIGTTDQDKISLTVNVLEMKRKSTFETVWSHRDYLRVLEEKRRIDEAP